MFTVVAQKDQADAEKYFAEHLEQNDYYCVGEIRPGRWIGAGAEKLGLKQHVVREQFHALCENCNPQTDERLTRRLNAKDQRRVFFDFTCSAPKSVSVLAVTLDDQRLVAAHEAAARLAFSELESFAATRVRKGGRLQNRNTGNLVAAAFTHTTSRSLDPQLHTHFTVFNATFDNAEQCWKALQAGGMYDAICYGTAVYRNELAKRIQSIGYRIRPAKHGFEIEGLSDEVLKRFSKRSQEVRKVVLEMEQRLGCKLSNNAIALAVHQSRASKLKGISTAEVRERQLAQLQPGELRALETLPTSVQPIAQVPQVQTEHDALTHAIAHVFERKSVVPEHELLSVALAHRLGEVDLPLLKQAVENASELVNTERGLSTEEVLRTESELIETVNAACDSVGPLHYNFKPADWLSEDQQRAISHILRTTDRITGLRGLAGTGKTTALRELVAACQSAGIELLFCAPTAAATDVLRKESLGAETMTLQSLLLSKPVLTGRHLVVLDEAGAVGIDDMRRLFALARDCRVLLSGDTGQHASVARGDALRILERHSDFKSGQLTQIRRQRRAEYRKAVELAAQKRTAEAFAQLERMRAVVESSQVYDSATQAYLKALAQNQSALLVAPTWNEIEAVTEKVRAALKTSGRLSGDETEVQVFDSLSWTEAQKRDARQYSPGMAIRLHRGNSRFAKDEVVAVVAVENNSIKVQRENGSEHLFELGAGRACFDVGEKRKLKIAAGDKLLLQANAARKQFVTGELVEVAHLAGDGIVLADGRIIPGSYRTFTHGYAVTSHAAQGKTVDEVLVVASSRSLPAVSQQQFYVSISRGRERCQLFTDDADLLRSHVTRSSVRLAAIEAGPHRRNFIRNILRQGHRFLKRFRERLARQRTISSRNRTSHHEHQRQSIRSISV